MPDIDQAAALAAKDEGNVAFKAGNNAEAIKCYSRGLKICALDSDEAVALHKNLAAVLLKTGDWDQVRYASRARGTCSAPRTEFSGLMTGS